MRGEAEVFPKPGKSFDPALIPKAIRDAGFSVSEIIVTAAGRLGQKAQPLELSVPGVNHAFVLSGGSQVDSLVKRAELLGQEIQVTGKLRVTNANQPPDLTVENFQPKGK